MVSQVTNCPTCGAVCRIAGHDSEGAPKLQALKDSDTEQKIQQLKQSLDRLQETLKTERSSATAKISTLEAELSELRSLKV